ncbi:MAG TPA: hypothetical protein VGI91_08365 [Steroidobacteraceae bacterium]
MNLALQVIAVAVLVSACAVYSLWRLLSGAARLRLLNVLATVPAVGSLGWFVALGQRTRARVGGGCGSCAASTTAASRKRTPGALPR